MNVWPSLHVLAGAALLVLLLLGRAPKVTARPATEFDYEDQSLLPDQNYFAVPKRTAMVLDKMMIALQRALDDETLNTSAAQPEQMDLQRRNQQKGRVYLRCYFNAVTCFRRKK
ncbi:uncharacterized protein LOC132195464 [Neocloeon triangulifer]|uniref:uncharacterized protein LOC132195464 n=1 Tax=Neocloeon triangulifer TaxID=2078957 RepID=UPI00286F37B2|nr:uncharacterized protein LOC132195464 [Neocloeon triangulifer]